MPIDINIPDSNLLGFNNNAKDELKRNVESFSTDLIAEANRLESAHNRTANGPEITSSIISDAHLILRHGIRKPKKNKWNTFFKISASVFSLLAGIMYQKDELQNTGYLVFYILIIAIAIILTTLSILKED
ncbi:hypothetical protein [Chryseobacterium terrae]|uniref:Uncharacterized protein n=1 Tax=Chryseobacterium terrae TaxID=3163299 RepID=A0ABW8Y326_9FLAO